MNETSPPLMNYHYVPAGHAIAAGTMRGWAVVNWMGMLVAVGMVATAFAWRRSMFLSPGDSFSGMAIFTVGGCYAVACAAWGMLCWKLGNAIALGNQACARIAMSLNLLLGAGCVLSVGTLYVVRHASGALRWTGMEGHAWRVLLPGGGMFAAATLVTVLILWRAVTAERHGS